MKNKNKILIMAMIAIMLFSSITVSADPRDITNIKISLNGTPLDIPTEYGTPFIDNQSRTIIPLRIISERLGHKVEWDKDTQTAIIDGEISIAIGQKIVKTPKGDVKMDTFAILKDSRTYVPLRFVVEALGYEVSYNGPNYSNGYQHMVNISGTPKTPVDPTGDGKPVKDGNKYIIQTEMGEVELDMDADVDRYGHITDVKARELLEPLHKSMKLTETEKSVKINFHLPEMPKENGLRYSAMIDLKTKDGRYLNIWSENGKGTWTTNLGNGYFEVALDTSILNITMTDVEYIILGSQVHYNGKASSTYQAELRTGAVAFGQKEFLNDKIREMKK